MSSVNRSSSYDVPANGTRVWLWPADGPAVRGTVVSQPGQCGYELAQFVLLDEPHSRIDYQYSMPDGHGLQALWQGRLALIFANLKPERQSDTSVEWDTCGGAFHSWSLTKRRQRSV